jgi:hypothetical protein
MTFLRSNARSRARSRLATSKPVNVIFSNGLGVCKLGNAGSRSICKKRSSVPSKPVASAFGFIDQFDYDGSDTADIKLKFKTNINDAKIELTGKIGSALVASVLITQTAAATVDNFVQISQAFDSNINGLTNGVVISDIKLKLTGGKISPSKGWNINNVEYIVGIPNITIDLAAPTLVSAEVFSTAKNKIIVTFSEPIKANPTLPVGAFALANLPGSVTLNAATVVNGKVELTLSADVVADPNTAENITLDYDDTIPSSPLMDVAGNLVGTFTAEQVAIFGEFQISGITVVSDNSNPAIAIAGDKLTFTVELNKPVTVASATASSDVKLPFKINNNVIDSEIDLPVIPGSTLTFSHTLLGTESSQDGSIKSIVSTLPNSGGQYPPFKLSLGTTVKDSDGNELTGGTPAISGTDVVFYAPLVVTLAQVGYNGIYDEIYITLSNSITTPPALDSAGGTFSFGTSIANNPSIISQTITPSGQVKIVLDADVVATDTPVVSYTNVVNDPIKDAQGNFLDSFVQTPVLFNVSFDSAEVGTNGNDNEVFITFSEVITSISNPVTTDFTIGGVDSTPTVTSIAGTVGTIKLTLSANVVTGDTPTVAFTATTTVIKDANGNPLADFGTVTPKTITNNT